MRQKSSFRPEYLAAGALFGFILLAAALDGFELADGLRIETSFAETVERAFEMQDRDARNPYDGRLIGWVVSIVVGLSIILFFVGLLRQENRLSTLFLVILGAGAVLLISRIPPPPAEVETAFEEGGSIPGAGEEAISLGDTLAEEDAVDVSVEPPEGPRFWSWILAGVALVGVFLVVRPRLPAFRRKSGGAEQESLHETARTAIRDAESGGDILQTVVRCYRDMLELYRQSRYLGRYNTLTPRELTTKLVEAGVPGDAAEGLTELFERARYGTIKLTPEEEATALGHLRVISDTLEARGD